MRDRNHGCNDCPSAWVRMLTLMLWLVFTPSFAAFAPPSQLIIVTDDNYPPYLFRADDGQLEGIIKDKWELWSKKTGVPVKVEGMAWSRAQASVQDGSADVIDTLAFTEARTKLYEFSPPYASIEARVFFHRTISGINDVTTLRGFTIGAKEGSACANWLNQHGIQTLRNYPSSEVLVRAAGAGEVRLFCMDDPAARYLLLKNNLADDFRETPPLYAARFHWAVVSGRTDLRDFIRQGFARVTPREFEDINTRWLGNPLKLPIDSRYFYYLPFLVGIIIITATLMMLWNRTLRRRVSAKTAELNNAAALLQAHADKVQDLYNNAPCGYHSLNTDGVFVEINDTELEWLGYTRDEVVGKLRLIDFLDEEGSCKFGEMFPRFKQQGAVRDMEHELTCKDGSTLSVLISATAVRDERGNFLMTRSTVYDITQRKRAEQALGATLDHTPNVAVQWFDAQGRVRYWNNASTNLYGWSATDAIGKTLDEIGIYSAEQQREFMDALRLIDRINQALGPDESSVRRKDGSQRMIMSTLFVIPGPANEKRYVCMDLDVTGHRLAERERERLNAILTRVTEAVPVCLSYLDAENRYVWTNTRNSERLATVPERMIGKTAREVYAEQNVESRGALDAVMRQGRPLHDEQAWRGPDGTLRTYERFLMPDVDAQGVPRGCTSLWLDITERKEADRKINRLNRVYAVLSNINSALVRIKNRQELFDEACRIAVEHGKFGVVWIGLVDPATEFINIVALAGADADELNTFKENARRDGAMGSAGVLGPAVREKRPVFNNDLAAMGPAEGTRLARAVQLGYRSVIVLPLLIKGEAVGILAMTTKEANFFNDEEVKLLTELAGDVAFAMEVIEKEKQLNYLAYYDTVTGLPNRTLLHERLEQQLHMAQQKGSKVALLIADLRRFRFINETLGRAAGDILLRQLSTRLQSVLPDADHMGRVAGDRFAVVLTDFRNETEIVHWVEKAIIESLNLPFNIQGQELAVAMTAGIAVYPDDGANADTLFHNAEAAVNQAKLSATRYLFYQSQMNARIAETLVLENKIRRALAREEFVLHYQPKLHLADGRITGFEALIRWNDPESGIVAPGSFIPILEETGMIVDAGLWAMRRVLRDYGVWKRSGLNPPRVAVNVSAIQLRQQSFIDVVRAVMNEAAADARGLDMEITESLLMEDIEGSIAKLRAMRDMGINIAIDDFGTGYSSLAYLTRLPVNALKIDRSFVQNMTRNPDDMTIVSTVISLAHALNLKVIAEGVETEEHARVLKQLKCDEMQGYLIGRPVGAEECERLLSARTGAVLNTLA